MCNMAVLPCLSTLTECSCSGCGGCGFMLPLEVSFTSGSHVTVLLSSDSVADGYSAVAACVSR